VHQLDFNKEILNLVIQSTSVTRSDMRRRTQSSTISTNYFSHNSLHIKSLKNMVVVVTVTKPPGRHGLNLVLENSSRQATENMSVAEGSVLHTISNSHKWPEGSNSSPCKHKSKGPALQQGREIQKNLRASPFVLEFSG